MSAVASARAPPAHSTPSQSEHGTALGPTTAWCSSLFLVFCVRRVLGPEPWNVCYPEPSIRPDDSRYGDNPNRVQRHTQFQVILKPDPGNAQELYLGSLEALGIDTKAHDVRYGAVWAAWGGGMWRGCGVSVTRYLGAGSSMLSCMGLTGLLGNVADGVFLMCNVICLVNCEQLVVLAVGKK